MFKLTINSKHVKVARQSIPLSQGNCDFKLICPYGTGVSNCKLYLQELVGLFLMKAENLAKMSAPTSKDSLLSGLRCGYLGGGDKRGQRGDKKRQRMNLFEESECAFHFLLNNNTSTIPGRCQCLLQKLLNLNKVSLEGTVVQ